MPRAALLGDLPALRPADLAAALEAAASVDRGVVADAEGTGSTLVTARAGVAWASAFGDGSFARHVALGCAPLDDSGCLDPAPRRRRRRAARAQRRARSASAPRTRRAARHGSVRSGASSRTQAPDQQVDGARRR